MGNNIILIGFKASGKTTLGRILAKRLSKYFIDTDSIIEEIYLGKNGEKATCREIYRRQGKEYFREIEKEAIGKITNSKNSIISIGGGALDDPENRDNIALMGQIVYLKEDPDILYNRIEWQDIPFFGKDKRGSFEKLFKERSRIYSDASDVEIDQKGRSVEVIADEIITKVK